MSSTAELQTPLGEATHRVRFPSRSDTPAAARRYVRDVLKADGPDVGADRVGELELVVSELVTNSVRYGTEPGDSLLVIVRLAPEHVRIEVHDPVRRRPRKRDDAGVRVRGRGLHIVDALTARWGVFDRPFGKAVWAEVPR